jgi:hypothetical protein
MAAGPDPTGMVAVTCGVAVTAGTRVPPWEASAAGASPMLATTAANAAGIAISQR